MRSKKFALYILVAFITSTVLLIYIQFNSAKNISALIEGNNKYLDEYNINSELKELEKDLVKIESNISNVISTNDSEYIKDVDKDIAKVQNDLNRLQKITDDDSTVQEIDELDLTVQKVLTFNKALADSFYTKGKASAEKLIATLRGKRLMDSIFLLAQNIENTRHRIFTNLTISNDKRALKARFLNTILIVFVLVCGAGLFWYIINTVRRKESLIQQLHESEIMIKETAKVKEQFMANMSHEIRTPMNAILGFTNLLQKEPLNVKSREFLNSIQNSGESLLTIINDILDFSKIEAGMMRIELNPFSLRGLLHSVETMFATRIQPKNLRLTVDVEKSIPDVLIGDAIRLTQILVNLVNNSVKFTSSGGIEIRVTADKEKEDTIKISFSVKDTGIGIPPNKMETIFERFQQADEDTTRKYGGTGLGLSIVKELVELQNGNISVSSIQNAGTEFVFTIPYTISEELTERHSHKILADDEIKINENNIKILVAEDNYMNQSLMKHLLADWTLDFDIVNNGKEAIEVLQQKKYSLVLMDIQMPQMDGYTATMKIRNELRSDIPIIAMTAHAMAGEREKCLSYGMNEYIPKPIRENELFKIINNILKTNTEKAGRKNENDTITGHIGNVLDLSYLKELSGGNVAFEVSMIEQFLQQVPGELEALQDTFNKKNYVEAAQIAHNMKTSVSFMGLTEKLDTYLDYIETNAGIQKENASVQEKIMVVNKICKQFFGEAKEYLERIA
jgi:signal transduction histidine kinase/response regulator RpfG family c-di-GMP phosphodiesterase